MNNFSKVLSRFIQIAIVGIILVQTKRGAQWLFWPLYVLLVLFLSPWLVILFGFIFQVIIGDFILGVSLEFSKFDWLIGIIWVISFIVLIPSVYNAIEELENLLFKEVKYIPNHKKILGFIWGVAGAVFVLYRLDFFKWVLL